MGQSQANGRADAPRQHQPQHPHPPQHPPQHHPTSAAFARVADFAVTGGDRLLTDAGFAELFTGPDGPLVPAPLVRAAWLASPAAATGRDYLTPGELAELHDRLAGGGADAQRQLLAALIVAAGGDSAAAADAVLAASALAAEPPAGVREALARLLRPPPAVPDDDNVARDPAAAAAAEAARLALRHLPQLMSTPTALLLACLRSAAAPTPAGLLADAGGGSPPPRPPADVAEPWLGWALACQLPPVFAAGMPTAQLLYDTEVDLRSPSRLIQLVFDYGGPTLLLATAEDGRLFCVAADRGFRDAWEAYGEADCRLAQLLPDLRVLLSGAGILYANFRASVGRRGVSVGRNPAQAEPVLLIGPELDIVSVFGVPSRLARLRALGLGDPGLVERLRAERERDQRLAAIARDRKLRTQQEGPASAAWEQNVDRQLLEWGGVRNAGGNARLIEGREAELGMNSEPGGSDGGPSRLLKPEF